MAVKRVPSFSAELALTFSLALGVVLGGSFFGAVGGLFGGYPARTMWRLAGDLKLWAVVAALGGDIETFRRLEQGILRGQFLDLGKQVLLLVAAFAGAHLGVLLIMLASGVRR
jgi:hypothetical protein